MTIDERRATLVALWRSVRALIPKSGQAAIDDLCVAIEAVYNDHADARAAEAHAEGRREGEGHRTEADEAAFRAGMLAVKKRSDFRDLDAIEDPEELRSTH